jgi:ferrous iron transport protein B
MMMVYMRVGMMTDPPEFSALRTLLEDEHGWTLLTAVNLMLFSLLHNPCATTIMTIFKETQSFKWTILSVVITLGLAFLVTFTTASIVRLLGGM